MRKSILPIILLLMASPAVAQQPPRAEDFAESPQELANKAVVLNWDRLRSEGKGLEATETYLSPSFKEHISLARRLKNGKSDYENQLEMARRMAAAPPRPTRAPPPGIVLIPSQARASDDLVTLYHSYGADIFRVVDGKITDHWDATPWLPYSTNGEEKLLASMTPPAPKN